MKKVSVIIPAYNAEKFIRKCLDSLVNQTLKEIEMIIINDESKDNTLNVLKEYKKKYPDMINIINQKNAGPGGARNAGLECATGEYIAFVDSDDYIDLHMLQYLYEEAKKKDYDMVVCDSYTVYPDHTVYQDSGITKETKKVGDIKRNMIFSYAVLWNKIYKRSLLEDVRFIKYVYYEDIEYLHRVFPKVQSIGVVKEPLYYYIQQEGSITYTYNEKLYDIVNNFNGLIESYKELGYYKSYKNELEYSYIRYTYATFLNRLAKCKNKEEYNRGVSYALKQVKMHFPNHKENPYLKEKGKKNFYLKHFNVIFAKCLYLFSKNKSN